MRIRILGSAPAGTQPAISLSSYLVNDDVAVDGGSLGLHATDSAAARVRHVFLTHPHIDHVATLPIFLEAVAGSGAVPVRLYAERATLESLRRHVFNGSVWVDLAALEDGGSPAVEVHELSPESTVELPGLRVTAVPVAHAVPTLGYVLDDGSAAVALGADSGPTERLWEVARATGRLRAAFLECSFPDDLAELAARTGHLTPRLCDAERRKLGADVTAIAVHLKPRHRERIVSELRALPRPIEIGAPDRDYRW